MYVCACCYKVRQLYLQGEIPIHLWHDGIMNLILNFIRPDDGFCGHPVSSGDGRTVLRSRGIRSVCVSHTITAMRFQRERLSNLDRIVN